MPLENLFWIKPDLDQTIWYIMELPGSVPSQDSALKHMKSTTDTLKCFEMYKMTSAGNLASLDNSDIQITK